MLPPNPVIVAIVGIILFFFLLFLFTNLIQVSEGDVLLLERWGQKLRTITKAGLYFKFPWDDVVFRKSTRRQLLDTPPIECHTKDRIPITIDTFVYYRIVDADKAHYGVDNYVKALTLSIKSQLVDAAGKLRVNEIDNATLEDALLQFRKKTTFGDIGIILEETRIESIKHPQSLDSATQTEVTQRHRAIVEEQRVEAELNLEKRKLQGQGEKAAMEQGLERLRLKAQLDLERLEQERTGISGDGLRHRLLQLKEAGLLDAYIALEQQETWARIFESEHGPSTLIVTSDAMGLPTLHAPVMLPPITPRHRGRRDSVVD